MADSLDLGAFPASASNKLDIQWGVGREILLVDVGSAETEESALGCAQWDEPSSSQRQVAYDTMKLYRALHTQALQDHDKAARLQSILEYSQEITSVLQAACSRPSAQDEGLQTVKEDCCAWELLQLFYILAPRLEGFVTQDLVLWMKTHNALLSTRETCLQEALYEVCAEAEEQEAAPQTVSGYWQVFQRLVLVGWVDDARDLLFSHSELHAPEEQLSRFDKSASSELLEQVDALLRCMPQVQPMHGQAMDDLSFLNPDDYTPAREQWQLECVKLLENPRLWDECRQTAPDTAEALRVTLSVMSGDREDISNIAASWLELLLGMLLYGLPTKAATRHAIPLIITQCLSTRAEAEAEVPPPAGLSLPIIEELLPAVSETDTARVLSAVSQLSLWFKAHMPDILIATPQGKSVLSSSLEHEGGDVSEKLTLAYAHSLMGYPTTWHVAAAYLAWCPCHGAEAMQQLLWQLPMKGDSRLANQLLQQCQLYGLPQLAVALCRQMGVHHWQSGRTAAALTWFIRGHDESRASQAAAPLTHQIEAMLADTTTGFQAMPALANLEGLLNSLASPSGADENAVPLPQQAKVPSSVQRRGALGFLQGFLKLQQAMQDVQSAQDQSQLQKGASAVRDMVMVLIGRKIAPQRTWLPLLFHTIPVMESTHPPVFSHTDTQRLLSRLQEATVWLPNNSQNEQQHQLVAIVRLALVRSVAQAHLTAFPPALPAQA
ncbi:hypothetical protein ABBQ32_002884 [Trebouxia sp. C0010 RCD-2024]